MKYINLVVGLAILFSIIALSLNIYIFLVEIPNINMINENLKNFNISNLSKIDEKLENIKQIEIKNIRDNIEEISKTISELQISNKNDLDKSISEIKNLINNIQDNKTINDILNNIDNMKISISNENKSLKDNFASLTNSLNNLQNIIQTKNIILNDDNKNQWNIQIIKNNLCLKNIDNNDFICLDKDNKLFLTK